MLNPLRHRDVDVYVRGREMKRLMQPLRHTDVHQRERERERESERERK